MKILFCAAPFGFGPVAKAITIAERLAPRHELSFAGSGVALQLAQHESMFSDVVEVDYDDHAQHRTLAEVLERHDLVVSSVEPAVIAAAEAVDLPRVYVDSLLWMWDELPAPTADATLYLAQRYPGVEASPLASRIRHLRWVGPIVDLKHATREPEPGSLLINLAGLESPFYSFGRNLHYAEFVLNAVHSASYSPRWTSVTVVGNARVLGDWSERHGARPEVNYVHLSHSAFLRQLSHAEMLVTSPGLTTTYEAMAYGVPIRFLPPQNYSQALMLDFHRRRTVADVSLTWGDIYPELTVRPGLPEAEGVELVVAAINRAHNDALATRRFAEVFEQMLSLAPPAPLKQREALGIVWTDGAAESASAIDTLHATVRG